jgi:hypothetical protein
LPLEVLGRAEAELSLPRAGARFENLADDVDAATFAFDTPLVKQIEKERRLKNYSNLLVSLSSLLLFHVSSSDIRIHMPPSTLQDRQIQIDPVYIKYKM